MAKSPLQASRPKLSIALAFALVAAGLAGCQSRDPTSTGSISFGAPKGSEAELREMSADLGRKYESNPGNPDVALEYARVLRALGQTTQAAAVLQQAALRSPNHPALLAAYGKILADSGRYREAAAVLANAHQPDRPDWRILSTQGAVADQLGQFEEAQAFYAAALKIVPGEPSVLANQGLSLALAKRLDEAERILTAATQHPRADARVRRNLALVLGLRGRLAEADAMLRRDLAPKEAEEAMAGIRGMVRQQNSWKAIRQADQSSAPHAEATKTDARRPVGRRASAGLMD